MGHWSVFASVDYMDENSNYDLSMTPEKALETAELALTSHGRVEVRRTERGLEVRTVKHTPAWALATLIGWLFIRQTRNATVTVQESRRGAVLAVRGSLDTRAALRLRALAVASGRDVLAA
jgi:hypothetical protein